MCLRLKIPNRASCLMSLALCGLRFLPASMSCLHPHHETGNLEMAGASLDTKCLKGSDVASNMVSNGTVCDGSRPLSTFGPARAMFFQCVCLGGFRRPWLAVVIVLHGQETERRNLGPASVFGVMATRSRCPAFYHDASLPLDCLVT